jgi:hypothetical protein
MTIEQAHVEQARRVADALLYEGFPVSPRRPPEARSQVGFHAGVLMPPAYRGATETGRAACQTECVIECPDRAQLEIVVRFLRLQHRSVYARDPAGGTLREVAALTVAGVEYTCADEAREQEEYLSSSVASLLGSGAEMTFHLGLGESYEGLAGPDGKPAGRLTRRWPTLQGAVRARAQRVSGRFQAVRLSIVVENRTRPEGPLHGRGDGLRHALIAVHTLIGIGDGRFLSMTDPPAWAAAEIAACTNVGTWPVLAGPPGCGNLMMSSPVTMDDHPEVIRMVPPQRAAHPRQG